MEAASLKKTHGCYGDSGWLICRLPAENFSSELSAYLNLLRSLTRWLYIAGPSSACIACIWLWVPNKNSEDYWAPYWSTVFCCAVDVCSEQRPCSANYWAAWHRRGELWWPCWGWGKKRTAVGWWLLISAIKGTYMHFYWSASGAVKIGPGSIMWIFSDFNMYSFSVYSNKQMLLFIFRIWVDYMCAQLLTKASKSVYSGFIWWGAFRSETFVTAR